MNTNIGGVKKRKEGALNRLEAQLKSGVKPDKNSQAAITRYTTGQTYIPLTDKDKERIEKEMNILELKLKKLRYVQ